MSVLKVFLLGDASGLTKALSQASGRLQKFSGKVKSLGSQVSSLSVPLALAGGSAVKMASDFDRSMTMVKSLVGVAGDEVDAMAPKVKAMATQFGISSSQSAEALFFITSAGLRGAQAMEVLSASLKASAVGLGETKVVADLATSALNAYGSETLSAVGATDVLTAAVREGKLEADTLGQAMGSVLPVASAMGVQFHEVGAAFAAMSRTGTNAFTASTQLRGILNSLLKPTSQAEDMLTALGLSSRDLRKQIREEGLLSVLETLKNSFEGNDMAAQTVFGNVRALSGVLDLLGSNVQTTRDIFNRMRDTLGTTDKAFEETEKSSAFKLKQAITSLRNSFSSLGESVMVEVIPRITKMVGVIRGLFQRFMELSPAVKKISIAFAGLVIALPVLTTIIGAVGSALALLMSPITLVVAGVTAIAVAIYKNWNKILPIITKVINYFIDLYNESLLFRANVQAIALAFKTVFSVAKNVAKGLVQIFSSVGGFIVDSFTSVGDVIKGILTFDSDLIQKGLSDGIKGFGETVVGVLDTIVETGAQIGTDFATNFNTAVANVATKEKLPLVTEEQVQGFIDDGIQIGKNLILGVQQGIASVDIGTGLSEGAFDPLSVSFVDIDELNAEMEILDQFAQKANDRVAVTQEHFAAVGEAVTGELNNVAMGIGQAIGQVMAQGGSLRKKLAKVLLSSLGNIMQQMGKMAIKIGIGLKAIKKAFESLNPLVAIAAGIALVALGAYFTAKSSDIGGQIGGGGGATAFASGGIVSAPTLGLVGEYAGARRNPEVIAPLNKLKDMLPKQSGQGMGGAVSFRIEGQDLVGVLDKAEDTRNRLT